MQETDRVDVTEAASILVSMNSERLLEERVGENQLKRKRSNSLNDGNNGDASSLSSVCVFKTESTTDIPQDQHITIRASASTIHTSVQAAFSLIEAICTVDDISLYLTTQFLPPRDFLTLYCISKRFHYLVDSHITSYILSSARRWAPITSRYTDATRPTGPHIYSTADITTLLPFHNFIHLCTFDPVGRVSKTEATGPTVRLKKSRSNNTQQSTLQRLASAFIATAPANGPKTRHVPTIRYLFFVHYRSLTIQSIIRSLWLLGHRLPPSTPSVLIKLWYTLDIPTTGLREALFRNTEYWTDHDLRVILCFCMKLDMVFTDPVDGRGEIALRQMMLAQRTLAVLDNVLARRDCRNTLEMMKHWVRWKYKPRQEHRSYSILGVPPEEVGCLEKEGWGMLDGAAPGHRSGVEKRLMRPDELALNESVRRGIDVRKQLISNMISGYIYPLTLEDLPTVMGFGRGVDASTVPGL